MTNLEKAQVALNEIKELSAMYDQGLITRCELQHKVMLNLNLVHTQVVFDVFSKPSQCAADNQEHVIAIDKLFDDRIKPFVL